VYRKHIEFVCYELTIDSINVVPIIPRAVCRRHSFRPVRKEHSVARSCIRVTVAARSGHECDVVTTKSISTKAAGCTTAASAAAVDALQQYASYQAVCSENTHRSALRHSTAQHSISIRNIRQNYNMTTDDATLVLVYLRCSCPSACRDGSGSCHH
jgi:hypothetical protein